MNNRTKLKILTVLHGVMKRAKRVWKLPRNPIIDVEKPLQTHRTDIDVFSPEDVMALVRAAASEQDAAIYLTAAFTGLRRGELVALRWGDVDFARRHVRVTASYTERSLTTRKSGKIRSVPLAPVVAEALARLGQRREFTGEEDLVFPGIVGTYLDASALYRRYKAALRRAGLRNLRFHDLRHTFGTQVIGNPRVSILQLLALIAVVPVVLAMLPDERAALVRVDRDRRGQQRQPPERRRAGRGPRPHSGGSGSASHDSCPDGRCSSRCRLPRMSHRRLGSSIPSTVTGRTRRRGAAPTFHPSAGIGSGHESQPVANIVVQQPCGNRRRGD